jgi:hypothetical protein
VGSLHLLHSESGETLGPSGPGSSAVFTVPPFLKVLLDSGRSGVLGAWWKSQKAQRLRVFFALSIRHCRHFYSFGHVLLSPQHFFVSNHCMIGVVAI